MQAAFGKKLPGGAFSEQEISAEREEIMNVFRGLRLRDKMRQTSLACYIKCGGTPKLPLVVPYFDLRGDNAFCFGDCMNINLENGPWLNEMGEVPTDAIPKKFIWGDGHGAHEGTFQDPMPRPKYEAMILKKAAKPQTEPEEEE